MDAAALLKAWEVQDGKHRPAFVREHAADLTAHVSTDDPIPRTTAAIAAWLDRYRGTVTGQLREAVTEMGLDPDGVESFSIDGPNPPETTTTDDDEPED